MVFLVRSGHEQQASNVASPKLLPLGNAYTSMAFLSLTRNSGSTANAFLSLTRNRGSTASYIGSVRCLLL
ncbi:MAG: hypothetical protein J6J06_05905 [Bacteroidaceae bacterium]|nr:hypothetical protein [Bacteroidaceae bacterium]